MRERTIVALWKRLAGGQGLRLRVVSVLVVALGSAALLVGPGVRGADRKHLRFATGMALALCAMLTLALSSNAAPQQQAIVNICDRTPEVETWILDQLPGGTTDCAAVTSQQLAAITDPTVSVLVGEITFNTAAMAIEGYSSPILLSSDFAGLTGITKVFIYHSPALTAIPAGAFGGFTESGLTEINLSHNGIKTLEVGAFEGMTSLTELDLRYNRITELTEGIFGGLTAVTDLILRENRLTGLPKDIFDGLSALEDIDFSINDLTTLPSGIFDGLDLDDIHLDNNSISTLPANVFEPLDDTLQFLWLQENDLMTLDKDIFDGLDGLLFLILSRNKISSLDKDIFDSLDDSLELLALNGNEITSLDETIFQGRNDNGLGGVRSLYLHDNKLSTLPADLFDPFDDTLQNLFLRDNSITTLPADIFSGLTGVSVLPLSGNSLMSLPETVFTGISTLQILTLNDNSLSTLETDLFDPLDGTLKTLYLHNNGLTALHENIFDGLDGLADLRLNGNSLSTLETDLFDPLDSSLKTLYLQDNSLTALDVDIFDGLHGLEDLRLNGNSIGSLAAGVFEDLDDSLKTLYLQDIDGVDDDLTTLPAMVFSGLTGLQYLDLSCNGLAALDLARFDPFATTLLYLDISANGFTTATKPTEAAITAKLTNANLIFDLNDTSNCLSAREAGLSTLTLSSGTLNPPFVAPGVTVQDYYFVDVEHTVSTLTIVPTPKHSDATVEPAGQTVDADMNTPGLQVELTYGNNIVQWRVVSKDGATTTNYYVEVFRAHPPAGIALLSELVLSGVVLTPAFKSGTDTYTADVAPTVTDTTVTATALDPDATAMVKLGGTVDPDGTVDLATGSNSITVEVTAEDANTMRTYTVTVTRAASADASLSSLSLSGVTLNPPFTSGTIAYTASVANNVSSTTVMAQTTHDNATAVVKRGGMVDLDRTVDLAVGSNSVTVEVTAEDGAMMQTYTVIVTRAITAGVTVTPTSLTVGEGGSGTYTVALDAQPSGEVIVTIVDPADNTDVTAEPAALTFTTTNWDTAQTVTVSAVQDADMDDDTATVTHTVSGYGSVVTAASVTVTVTEDPTARYDYDGDDDGLIEVTTVAQLNAIRWDLDGDGGVDPSGDTTGYGEAFPTAIASMGCAAGCTGYELTADLDLENAGNSGTGWEPIGGMSGAFTATFDGGAPEITVRNLYIDSSVEGVGLFGTAGDGSVIRNVTLADVRIYGDNFVGALVGRNSGSIIDSSATGNVWGSRSTGGLVGASVHPGGVIVGSTAGVEVRDSSGGDGFYMGGLVGLNGGPIIDSHATGNVIGEQWVGGLVGWNSGAGGVNRISGSTASGTATSAFYGLVGGLVGWNNGPISDSHATGDVRGYDWVGGLVGLNEGAGGVNRISGSTAGGTVTSTGDGLVGGLVGWNNGPISDSHAIGNVSGVGRVGGLVGSNDGAGGVNRISGSTAAGAVTGASVRDGDYAGGLVGRNNGPISGSHATGNVTGYRYVGGLVGSNYDQSIWDSDAVGLNTIKGSTASGVVDAYGNWVGGLAGWNNGPISDSDARGTRVSGHLSVGGLVGSNYNGENGGGGTTISRSTASAAVEGTANTSRYLGGLVGWNTGPISNSDASGSVEGLRVQESGGLVGWNSGSITDSSASGDVGEAARSAGESVGGLVGLNKGGMIRGSSATGDVTSTSSTIGGLVGRNEGTITESTASGAVTGIDYVGGLVGYDSGVSISASRASGNVIGSNEGVGGLVGQLDGTIRTSYATGAVTGTVKVGGLVGRLVGAIIAAYASGDVSGSGDAVGGLVGQSDSGNSFTPTASSVVASYATGSVSGDPTNLGGLIGRAETPTGTFASPTFTDSYWDTERSSRSIGVGSDDVDADGSIGGSETATSGVTGQTTSALQMPTGYTGIYANWNIDNGDPWDFGGDTDDPQLSAPPNALPAFSSTAVLLTVAEDAAVGSDVGAAVTAADSDTLAYKLVGAGSAAFDIDSATGQLQVGAALDHETHGSYTVTVQASDGKSVAFKDVTVTVTGVDEPPTLSGEAVPAVADDGAVFVSTYTVADPEGDEVGALTWSLVGTDSSYFTIEDGRLSFRATPDYEDPNHGAGYDVTVQAAVAGQGSPLTLAVTVTVVNIDEAGVVSLSAAQPEDGVALTATLSDPDGGVSGITWQWARATSTNGAWTDISEETSDTYTPTRDDTGHYLRATASYDDAEGSGKSAHGISDNPLAAPGVAVTPTSLTVGEGGSNTYTVALNTQPSGGVTVTIVDPTDNADVTAEPAVLAFTTANWNSAQTVTVSAVQDADMDDDTATVTHTVSGYGSVVTAASVTVTVTEDPTAPYDTDGNDAIDKSEASEALRDYLADGDSGPFGGTTSKEVASEVLRRYLERS